MNSLKAGKFIVKRWAALMLFLLCFPSVVRGQFTYTNSNGTITITRYSGSASVVTIPASVEGVPVTGIGPSAFLRANSLVEVTIPSSVTNIGFRAFFACTNLVTVDLGAGVTSIGESAFSRCSALRGITLPMSLRSIGTFGFGACVSLTTVAIPQGVTNVSPSAFSACTNLTEIVVDPHNGFYTSSAGILFDKEQTTLILAPGGIAGSYTVPDSVTSLGMYAFQHCPALTAVSLPRSTTNLVGSAFGTSPLLTGVHVHPDNPAYRSVEGVLFDRNMGAILLYPPPATGSYDIPSSVTNIGDYSFYKCTHLTGVKIPADVAYIGNGAFFDCTSLTTVDIPGQVTFLGYGAFGACVNLTNVYFRGNTPSINQGAFFGSNKATLLYLPNTYSWDAEFDGRPTAPWGPRIQTFADEVGVRISVSWAAGMQVKVERSDTLTNPFWRTLRTETLVEDSLYFTDPQRTDATSRFYRVRTP